MTRPSNTSPLPARSGLGLGEILLQLAVPFGFFVVVVTLVPLLDRFELNPDEGIELMKGLLWARGHILYEQIWSNQTPLFTMALGAVFRWFGGEVLAGRILVLSSSTLLLWAVFQLLRTNWGMVHAFAGTLLLIMLPGYLRLSVSAMSGLPAVSLAALAFLFLSYWHRRRGWLWLVLSATAFCLSVLIKAFTVFLVPVFLLGIIAAEHWDNGRNQHPGGRWLSLVVWAGVFTAETLSLALALIGPEHFAQLGGMHELARSLSFYQRFDLESYLSDIGWLLLLVAVALPLVVGSKRWVSLHLVAWFAAAFLVLAVHIPVWFHHMLLLTVPAAMLAGVGIGEAVTGLRAAWASRDPISVVPVLAALILLTSILAVLELAPALIGQIRVSSNPEKREVWNWRILDKVREYAADTRWIFTDRYIYAFRTGLSVPPPLVSISEMQIRTGLLTEEQILQSIRSFQPEQILLARFDFPAIRSYANEHYRLVYQLGNKRLYIKKDLQSRPPASVSDSDFLATDRSTQVRVHR